MRCGNALLACLVVVVLAGLVDAQTQDTAQLLETLRKVDREAKGHRAATEAWAELTTRAKADELPAMLAAIDGAGPLAANWLRAAVDAVAERQLEQTGKLPLASLEKFLADRSHDQRARRLAYEWIVRNDPAAKDRWIPKMLDDPSLELRRDGVAQVITAAEKALADEKKEQALSSFRTALVAARDLDQVKVITEALAKLGSPVDLPSHFGFIQDWKVVAPFDNRGGKGFDEAFPPEARVDFTATYSGQNGEKIAWKDEHTDDPYGAVDLNKAISKLKGVVAYVAAEFNSDLAQPVELRLGTECANKIWLNGNLLSTAGVYHANGTMDQYVGRGELKAGRNLILLKICQNEQTEEWAQDWKFQLRVCDATGKAVLAVDRPAPKAPKSDSTAQLSKE